MRLASILRRRLPAMERVGVATAAGVEIDGMAARPCLVCCTMLRANKGGDDETCTILARGLNVLIGRELL
jgi:hypothetical protein